MPRTWAEPNTSDMYYSAHEPQLEGSHMADSESRPCSTSASTAMRSRSAASSGQTSTNSSKHSIINIDKPAALIAEPQIDGAAEKNTYQTYPQGQAAPTSTNTTGPPQGQSPHASGNAAGSGSMAAGPAQTAAAGSASAGYQQPPSDYKPSTAPQTSTTPASAPPPSTAPTYAPPPSTAPAYAPPPSTTPAYAPQPATYPTATPKVMPSSAPPAGAVPTYPPTTAMNQPSSATTHPTAAHLSHKAMDKLEHTASDIETAMIHRNMTLTAMMPAMLTTETGPPRPVMLAPYDEQGQGMSHHRARLITSPGYRIGMVILLVMLPPIAILVARPADAGQACINFFLWLIFTPAAVCHAFYVVLLVPITRGAVGGLKVVEKEDMAKGKKDKKAAKEAKKKEKEKDGEVELKLTY